MTAIHQDVFRGKGLTAVRFAADTQLSRTHARAFQNNAITELVLPASVTRVDYDAFLDNPLTKVTIGAGVYLEGKTFDSRDAFKSAYEAQGAGTYLLVNGAWVKQ